MKEFIMHPTVVSLTANFIMLRVIRSFGVEPMSTWQAWVLLVVITATYLVAYRRATIETLKQVDKILDEIK